MAQKNKLKGSCKKCGACCRFMMLIVPEKPYRKKDVKQWLSYHGIRILGSHEGFMKLFIPIPCKKLNGNICSIQGRKPKMCKDFPTSKEQLLPGCGYYG